MEQDNKKIKRLQVWAVFIIIVGGISAYLLPEHSVDSFLMLLKDVVSMLIMQ